MFHKILVPFDLAHKDKLTKATEIACDMAKRSDAEVCFVGVTASAPSAAAHTEEEHAEKLDEFAAEQTANYGIRVTTETIDVHDPSVELHEALLDAVNEMSADLIVMASHVPGVQDHFFTSHAGHIAAHANVSVFVVR